MSPSQRRGKKLISEGDLILSSFFYHIFKLQWNHSKDLIQDTGLRLPGNDTSTTRWASHVIKEKYHYLINFKLIINLRKKLKRATVIQQFKAQPLYGGLKRNRYTAVQNATVIQRSLAGWSQLFYGIEARRGDPPNGGGPLAKEFLRALSFNSKF